MSASSCERGYSPSYEEICEGLGVSSLATVHKHVSTLEQKGFLVRGPHQSRSIEFGARYYQEARKRAREQRTMASATTTLPLLGRIAAGRPLEAVENPETISLADFAGKKDVFVLQVKGDSMIEEHILDGDYILVERTQVAQNGDVVVALVEGVEATLKALLQGARRAAASPASQPRHGPHHPCARSRPDPGAADRHLAPLLSPVESATAAPLARWHLVLLCYKT